VVQKQLAAVDTSISPTCDVACALMVFGDTVNEQPDAVSVTANVVPATVSVPLRADVVVFAAAA
jgi:hypothetical protein